MIVAAGHGGWGTVAAIRGLADPCGRIESALRSNDGLGKELAYGVVEIPLRKRTKLPKDDIEVDRYYEKLEEADPEKAWRQAWKHWS